MKLLPLSRPFLAALLGLTGVAMAWSAPTQDQIGFVEKFALAADREAVLGQLIPGSEESYFYHALHFQNTRQKEKYAAILEQWAKRFPRSEQRKIIENREALLTYDADPQATLKFLRERLDLHFNHQQEARNQKPNLPTTLDPARVARDVFREEALRVGNDDLQAFNQLALEDLVREKHALRPAQVRSLLSRLERPDLPNLVELIATDLRTRESHGFGEYPIHRALLPEQLDELARRVPALLENNAFVYARLAQLAPSADADAAFDPAEREAWLDRSWAYVSKLPRAFLSLKANLLYQRLQHDRQQGIYNAERFLAYLQMPRRLGYVNPLWLDAPAQQRLGQVDLTANFSEAISILPPIRNDEELVRDYFLHLLVKVEPKAQYDLDALLKPWLPYVRDSWLKPILAEAMITAGLGEVEQWTSLLTPSAFQRLKERVEVDFAKYNPPAHLPADDVSLDLYVKNAPKLLVRIYEINTLSYFLTNQKQLNTDLPLDGLVANRELTHDFSAEPSARNPFLRTLRTFKFPELKGKRGAWVIEFIGGGKSSRALVRKGQWSLLQRTGPAGELLTVLDEQAAPVPDAVVWLEGRRYAPDPKSGYIAVPFTQTPGAKPVILADSAGDFATFATLQQHAESYRLDAHFHLEREQLLARQQATLLVHPALILADATMPLELLTDTVLTIRSTSLDGISTTQEVKSPKLDAAKAFTHTFPVAERLATVAVTLTGKVRNLSLGGEKQEVTASETWNVNGIDKSEHTHDGYLSRSAAGYFYELLGKDAEPLADQQVVFTFAYCGLPSVTSIPLKTDAHGRILLGALTDLASVRAQAPNGREHLWWLSTAERTWPTSIHALAGTTIRVPLPAALLPVGADGPAVKGVDLLPRLVSLLEQRQDTFTSDRRAAVKIADGYLVLEGLAAGDYQLRLNDGSSAQCISLRVTNGTPAGNWLVSPNRSLEVREGTPLQIVAIGSGPTAMTVRLANWNQYTRVQVAATRFLPDAGLWHLGVFDRFAPASSTPDRQPSLYAAGREIGDEYRYILERRYAKIFPGNGLTRPGLILNPWEVRSTDLQAQSLAALQQAQAMGGARRGTFNAPTPAAASLMNIAGEMLGGQSPDLDFLATGAPLLLNLTPDELGVVKIDRAKLGDRQFVQVYAEDLQNAVWRTVALPEVQTPTQDLRLTRNLDPAKAFTEKKKVTALAPGQSLTLEDILTGELETYDSLGSVHSLFLTLSNDPNLARFGWILQWPAFTDDEKRAKYSEFACHELSFFLSRKDPAFFAKVIVPYLKNKKDKTFLDEYLLSADLRHWLAPWSYAQLNVAERCLLAQRLPGEAPAVQRHLRELWELLPPDAQNSDRLFATALRGRRLGGAEDHGFWSERARQLTLVNGGTLALGGERLEPASPAPAPAPAATPMGRVTASASMSSDAAEKIAQTPGEAEARLESDAKDKRQWSATRAGRSTFADRAAADAPAPAVMFSLEEARQMRRDGRSFFRALGPTKEWAEDNYYHLPAAVQNGGLITVNQFWRDYAAWDGNSPFVSEHLAEATHSFAEMMLALSVLDLPFAASQHDTKTEGAKYTVTARSALVAFHQEIQPTAEAADEAHLLVSQNFYRQGDRYRHEGNERYDKYVSDEFLSGVVYGANVVVTNPTSTPQNLEVLLQIPEGSLPVLGSKPTDSKHVQLEPYTTKTFEYWFYFPLPSPDAAQPFRHYPVHVARQEKNVGAAKRFTFKVVRQLSQIDTKSWDYVSQYGTDDEVFAFLEASNLERLALDRVAWRARQDVAFFRRIIALLAAHHVYNDVLYSYAVVHNEAATLGEWLRHRDDFLGKCGPYLQTSLFTLDPLERHAYEHLEYSPLVNQRAHRLGTENRLANPVLRGQYQALLRILAHKPALEPMDEMSVVYYLFAQDRVEEALARFHTINPAALPTRLQYDYFRCYAAFYEENLAEARGLASQYADYPVDRWRKLFREVAAQLDEITDAKPALAAVKIEGQPDREVQQADLAATEPSFDFKVENRQIALTWRNLSTVTVNYYLMEPEFLFSSSPFVTEDPARFSVIKPAKSAQVALPAGRDSLEIPLPPEFAKSNVLVEILGAGQRHAQAYHANTFKLALTENYGRLELREQTAGKAVSKAYVKVYARLQNGTVRFFKDGYTDLRGRFDYASLNSRGTAPHEQVEEALPGSSKSPGNSLNYQMLKPEELNQVERLSILIMHDAYGALVREVNPPSQ